MTEDIIAAKTTEALSDLLSEYCKARAKHNDSLWVLPYKSADELLLEVLHTAEIMKAHAQWLQAFILRWDAVQADEDFEHAIEMRGERP